MPEGSYARFPLTARAGALLRLLAVFGLGVIGLLLNEMRVPLLGVDAPLFSFSNVPVLLAFVWLGPWAGLLASLVSSARMLSGLSLLPAGAAAYGLEAWSTYMIYRRSGSLAFSAGLYWIGAGWIVAWIVYAGVLGLSVDYTTLVVMKQAVGGILNALIAESIVLLSQSAGLRSRLGSPTDPIPLRDFVFQRVVFIVLLPSMLIAILDRRSDFESLAMNAREQVAGKAHTVAAQLEAATLRREDALMRLARRIDQSLDEDRAASRFGLDTFRSEHPAFLRIAFANAMGRVIDSSPSRDVDGRNLVGAELGGSQYWKNQTIDVSRPSFGPLVVGGSHFRRHEAELMVPLLLPITDLKGRLEGALVASLDAESLVPAPRDNAGLSVTVLDRSGLVITSDEPHLRAGSPAAAYFGGGIPSLTVGSFAFRPPDTSAMARLGLDRHYAAVSDVLRPDWRVVVAMAPSNLHKQMAARATATLWLLLPTVGLLYFVAFRLTRDIANPVHLLTARARALAAGEGEIAATVDPEAERYTTASPVTEVRELARHFVDSEQRVADRARLASQHLSSVNEQLQAAHLSASEAEAQLRHLVESARVILWRADARTFRFSFVSAEAELMLGYPCEQWLKEPAFWRDHIHADDRDQAVSFCQNQTTAGKHHTFEYRMIAKGGKVVWLRDIVRVVLQNGAPAELVGVLVDISEQREAQDALRATEMELRSLVQSAQSILCKLDQTPADPRLPNADARKVLDHLSMMIDLAAAKSAQQAEEEIRNLLEHAALEWERTFDAIESAVLLVDERDNVVRANHAAQVLLRDREEPIPLSEISGAEPWRTISSLIRTSRDVGFSEEADAIDSTDGRVWAVTAFPRQRDTLTSEPPSVVVVARDVSDERLSAAHRRFLTDLWSALAHAERLDQAVKIILTHLCAFTGWEMGQVHVLSPDRSRLECVEVWHETIEGFERFHAASRSSAFARGEGILGRVWATGEPFVTNEFPEVAAKARASAARDVGLHCMLGLPVHSGDDVVAVVELFRRTPRREPVSMGVKVAAVAQLGTLIERYRAQAALIEHEQSHARLLSNLSGMAYRCRNDQAWTMTYVSEGCLELTGHPPDALLLGNPQYGQLIHGEDGDWVWSACQSSLAARRPCSNEYRIITAGGAEKWVWDQAQGVYDDSGQIVSIEGFITDISSRKQAEAELQNANTMIAMGELVAGVAHEVRNPLFAISANIDAFEARFGPHGQYAEVISTLRGEVERLIALMNDLLEYGRPASEALAPAALGPVVAQAIRACAGQALKARVHIRDRVSGTLPLILADRRRLVQVFQNLIENSIQHTPAGGFVDLEAFTETQGGRSTVLCLVSDTGGGIKEEFLPHLFEPFFSRRRGGTGLGLAIVKKIVLDHSASIRARNRASQGAEVEIRFPALSNA